MCPEKQPGSTQLSAQHIPTQPVREEPQGTRGAGVQILGFPSVNHIIFSITIK